MSKRPQSITDSRMANVARELGAQKTAVLIEAQEGIHAIVCSAVLELHPRDFRDLLERARDRQAAYVALSLFREYGREERSIRNLLGFVSEVCDDAWFAVVSFAKCRDLAELRREFAKLRKDIREFKYDARIAKRLDLYRDWESWLICFIADGPTASIIRDVLWVHRAHMTYERGEWLRKKAELLERTPEQIEADKAKKREANRLYWDPNYGKI